MLVAISNGKTDGDVIAFFYFQLSVHVIHDFPQFNLFDPPRKLKSASIPYYNQDERTKNSFLRN